MSCRKTWTTTGILKRTRGTIESTDAACWERAASAWYATQKDRSVDGMARRIESFGASRRNHSSLSLRLEGQKAGYFPRHPAVVHPNEASRAESTHSRFTKSSRMIIKRPVEGPDDSRIVAPATHCDDLRPS